MSWLTSVIPALLWQDEWQGWENCQEAHRPVCLEYTAHQQKQQETASTKWKVRISIKQHKQ